MWICARLLCTCKCSQASTAGHLGMLNLMPDAHNNKLYTKERKMTTHLPYGSYAAVHVLLLAMFTSGNSWSCTEISITFCQVECGTTYFMKSSSLQP